MRAIAEVATAVTKGDLTRSIQVETRGEVAELKDNINTMISNLRETTESNREQDWLKTNLAKFTGMLQGQRELNTVGKMLLTELAPLVNAQQGTIYHVNEDRQTTCSSSCCPAMRTASSHPRPPFAWARGWSGQCAVEKKRMLLDGRAVGLHQHHLQPGRGAPGQHHRAARAVRGPDQGGDRAGVAAPIQRQHLAFLDQLTQSIGVVFNTIEATMRTEGLLKQSQKLTVELQSRQSELQQTNEELGTKADCWPSRTRKWSARTRRWNRHAARWRRRPRSWR